MSDDDLDRALIVDLMRKARAKSRGYASFWEWPIDRPFEELGVVEKLGTYLSHSEGYTWANMCPNPNDPPDVVLISIAGERFGVEVTELVDGKMVERYRHRIKNGLCAIDDWSDWSADRLANELTHIIAKKDQKLAGRTADFTATYLAIFTDEPMVNGSLIREALSLISVCTSNLLRAFIVLSYDPQADLNVFPQGYPVYSLPLATRRGENFSG